VTDAKPALDGARFHVAGRVRCSEVTRAFASAIRAAAQGPQSELSGPDDVVLEDGTISEPEIVRGVD
jgi:hypothetical protein